MIRSMYIYPLLVIILIIFLRIKHRKKITATSKKKKKRQRKESLKQQKFLLKNRFGSQIFLPFFIFHLFINFLFGFIWDTETMIGFFVLDLLLVYLAWSVGTIGLWELPSGGGGSGYSGGGGYSSGSSYSGGSSYSSGGGSSFGGGSFGGGGASGDW